MKTQESIDSTFINLTKQMCNDRSGLWNTVKLYHLYQVLAGANLSRMSLISQLKCNFPYKIAIFSTVGLSSLVLFKDDALNMLSLVSDDDDDQDTAAMDSINKAIAY